MRPSMAALGFVAAACQGACGSDSKSVSPTRVSVATETSGDVSVELLTDEVLGTGLTPVYLAVTTAGGQPITDAAVSFVPMMAMTTGMNHSAPVIAPPALEGGVYHCDVVFQMPTGTAGSWSATVGVTRPDAATVELTFASLAIADLGRAKPFLYTDPDTQKGTKYVTSLNFVDAPVVGLNPVIVTLHWMESATSFPAVDDATITLDPQMPSMGHGSPGSVDPTPTSLGRYEGKLSFSMAGTWETTVTLRRGGVIIGAPAFTTEL